MSRKTDRVFIRAKNLIDKRIPYIAEILSRDEGISQDAILSVLEYNFDNLLKFIQDGLKEVEKCNIDYKDLSHILTGNEPIQSFTKKKDTFN